MINKVQCVRATVLQNVLRPVHGGGACRLCTRISSLRFAVSGNDLQASLRNSHLAEKEIAA